MKTTAVAIVALVVAVIAFIGMVANLVGVDTLQGEVTIGGGVQKNSLQIQYFDDNALDRALLTEDQRQLGMYLIRRNDGKVELRCPNGTRIATFDIDASVSYVRYTADMEMTRYWAGLSQCSKDT